MYEQEPVPSSFFDYSPDVFRSAVLKLRQPDVVKRTEAYAHGAGFDTKTEFHITLLPTKLFEKLTRVQADALAEKLRNVCDQNPQIEYEDASYIIAKQKTVIEDGVEVVYERESIVLPLSDDSALAIAIKQSYFEAGFTSLDIPFLHVTLFIRPSTDIARRGISIANLQEWQELNPIPFL